MGYCMNQQAAEFCIKAENIGATLTAIKNLHGKETYPDSRGKHFAWVDENFYQINDIVEMFEEWRWVVHRDPEGNIDQIDFCGEKYGDEDLLFKAIAPYVEPGSYIEMCGEDGEAWKWVFTDKKLKKQVARRVYDEEEDN